MFALKNNFLECTKSEIATWVSEKLLGFVCFEFLLERIFFVCNRKSFLNLGVNKSNCYYCLIKSVFVPVIQKTSPNVLLRINKSLFRAVLSEVLSGVICVE